MSQTSYERCGFPVPMRWLDAGGDLPRPNGIHQAANRALMPSEHSPKCLPHSPDLPCDHTCRWPRAGVLPIIEIGASIKSTEHSLLTSAQLPVTSCLGAFWTPVR